MPIYEYECKACQHVDEVMQKFDAAAPEACTACGKGPLVKLMSRSGFILKGGGWYVTDFRGGNKSNGRGAATPASTSAGGEGGGSSEAPKSTSTGDSSGGASTENKSSGGHGGGCHGGNCAN